MDDESVSGEDPKSNQPLDETSRVKPDEEDQEVDLVLSDRLRFFYSDIPSDGEFVYPQRQPGQTELVVPGKMRLDGREGLSERQTLTFDLVEDDGNCNVRSADDNSYYEMIDLLPSVHRVYARFDDLDGMNSFAGEELPEFEVPPLNHTPRQPSEELVDQSVVEHEIVALEMDQSAMPKTSEAKETSVGSSTKKLLQMLTGMLIELNKPGSLIDGDVKDDVDQDHCELNDEQEALINKWLNHDQLIETAYRRGLESSQERQKQLTQQLASYKQRLFEVSRDRQAIVTYVRRYERNCACRHERLRMEIQRLQKIIHDSQRSSTQLEENRQPYEGESGSPTLKAEETLDKILSVIVEHQSKINELKLTIFAQQQHILALEEERQNREFLLAANDNNLSREQLGCRQTRNECETRSIGANETQSTNDDQTLAAAAAAAAASEMRSSPLKAEPCGVSCCTCSKMSDVLLCDEGDYGLCQANQPDAATDEAITNLRCLCHHHGGMACGNFVQVQLVGQLPYLLDSPLDTEVAGVLSSPKTRPFSVADLPYVRQRTAGELSPENIQSELELNPE